MCCGLGAASLGIEGGRSHLALASLEGERERPFLCAWVTQQGPGALSLFLSLCGVCVGWSLLPLSPHPSDEVQVTSMRGGE